jgi:hypothetical protein
MAIANHLLAFVSNAVCKSVWLESVPVICHQATHHTADQSALHTTNPFFVGSDKRGTTEACIGFVLSPLLIALLFTSFAIICMVKN